MQFQFVFGVCVDRLVHVPFGCIRIFHFKVTFLANFAFFTLWLRFGFACPVLDNFQFSIQYVAKYFVPLNIFPVDASEEMSILRCDFVSDLRCPLFFSVWNTIGPEMCFRWITFHSRWLRYDRFRLLRFEFSFETSFLVIFYCSFFLQI